MQHNATNPGWVAAKRDPCRHGHASDRALPTVRTRRRRPTTPSTVAGVTEKGHGYRIEALGPQTWDAFADLAGRHNGVWGGCWCTYFHRGVDDSERTQVGNQAFKQHLVEQGRAHAALVFDGDVAVALVPVRDGRGAAEHPPPQGVGAGAGTAPRLSHHLSVRRPAVPPQGSSGDSRPRRLGADRHRRRRARRGLPARSSARQEDVGVVSLQATRTMYEQLGSPTSDRRDRATAS